MYSASCDHAKSPGVVWKNSFSIQHGDLTVKHPPEPHVSQRNMKNT